jgi:hypothetical protein
MKGKEIKFEDNSNLKTIGENTFYCCVFISLQGFSLYLKL